MKTTITLTKSWQLYLPEAIREALGIDKSTRMKAEVRDNTLVLTPIESEFLKLGGALQPYLKNNPDIDIENIRDYIDYSDL